MKECELQGTRSLHFPSVSSRSTEEKIRVEQKEMVQKTNLRYILCWRSWDGGQVVRVVGEVNNSDAVSVSLNLIIGKVKIENDLHFCFSLPQRSSPLSLVLSTQEEVWPACNKK